MSDRGDDRPTDAGRSAAPVERTLLTTGIIDAAVTSRFEFGRRIETPHLMEVRYPPGDYRFPQGTPWRGG
jgi:hypothetical protein